MTTTKRWRTLKSSRWTGHGPHTSTASRNGSPTRYARYTWSNVRAKLSFADLKRRVFAIANGLSEAGVGEGHNVGILCRNHNGFVEATAAVSALGADALFLNTGFAGPQLGEVLDRESVETLIYDEEFTGIVDSHGGKRELRASGRSAPPIHAPPS